MKELKLKYYHHTSKGEKRRQSKWFVHSFTHKLKSFVEHWPFFGIKNYDRGLPFSPVVKTVSKAGGTGLISGWGTKLLHAACMHAKGMAKKQTNKK